MPSLQLSLVDKLEGFKTGLQKKARDEAVERGKQTAQGVQLGKKDGITQAPEFKKAGFIGGIETRAHNESLRGAFKASLARDTRLELSRIFDENPKDLLRFNDQANALRTAIVDNSDPTIRAEVGESFDNLATSYQTKVQRSNLVSDREQAKNDHVTHIKAVTDDALRFSREGDVTASGEAAMEAFASIDSLVTSDLITLAEGDELKRATVKGAAEQSFMKQVDDASDVSILTAYDKIDELGEKTPKGWNPDEWQAFLSKAQTQVNRKANRMAKEDAIKKKELDLQQSISRGMMFMNPDIPADPDKTGQDRKDVNNAYGIVSQSWAGLPVNEQINQHVEFVKNTGLMPANMISDINAAARSGNVEQAFIVSDVVSRISEESPQSLKDLPAETQAISIQIADAQKAGIDPEQALEMARKNTFGTTEQEKEAIRVKSQAISKELPGLLDDRVSEDFDPVTGAFGIFGSAPDATTAMNAEFRTSFDNFMTFTGGNEEQAQKLAYLALKKTWGVTEVGGETKFMKYAPEAVYHVDGFDDDWVANQFNEEMLVLGHEGAVIGVDTSTARANNPTYPVMINNENGILEPLRDEAGNLLRWKPDITITKEYQDMVDLPGKIVEKAKDKREWEEFKIQKKKERVRKQSESAASFKFKFN